MAKPWSHTTPPVAVNSSATSNSMSMVIVVSVGAAKALGARPSAAISPAARPSRRCVRRETDMRWPSCPGCGGADAPRTRCLSYGRRRRPNCSNPGRLPFVHDASPLPRRGPTTRRRRDPRPGGRLHAGRRARRRPVVAGRHAGRRRPARGLRAGRRGAAHRVAGRAGRGRFGPSARRGGAPRRAGPVRAVAG